MGFIKLIFSIIIVYIYLAIVFIAIESCPPLTNIGSIVYFLFVIVATTYVCGSAIYRIWQEL